MRLSWSGSNESAIGHAVITSTQGAICRICALERAALARESSEVQPGKARVEDKVPGRLRIVCSDVSVHVAEAKREAHASRQLPSSRDIHRGKTQQTESNAIMRLLFRFAPVYEAAGR